MLRPTQHIGDGLEGGAAFTDLTTAMILSKIGSGLRWKMHDGSEDPLTRTVVMRQQNHHHKKRFLQDEIALSINFVHFILFCAPGHPARVPIRDNGFQPCDRLPSPLPLPHSVQQFLFILHTCLGARSTLFLFTRCDHLNSPINLLSCTLSFQLVLSRFL